MRGLGVDCMRLASRPTTSHLKERQSPAYENGASSGIAMRALCLPGTASTGTHVSYATAWDVLRLVDGILIVLVLPVSSETSSS